MTKIYEEAKARIPNQKEKVLLVLQSEGTKGVTNAELNEICFRYGHIMYLLKLDGYDIDVENLGQGLVKYTLKNTPLKKINYEKGIVVVSRDIVDNFDGNITAEQLVTILDKYNLNIIRKPNGLK